MKPCRKCKGSRHIWNEVEQAWGRCECLTGDRTVQVLRLAAVPEIAWKEEFSGLVKYLRTGDVGRLERIESMAISGSLRKVIGLTGGAGPVRRIAAGLVVRGAVLAGKTARVVRLEQVVGAEFEREEGLLEQLEKLDVLWVQTESVRSHKWNGKVLRHLCEHRWENQRATVVTSYTQWSEMRHDLDIAVDFLLDLTYTHTISLGV